MHVLITGAAGFIGSTLAHALLDRGATVIGLDNLNDYYDVNLKRARLARLQARPGFAFRRVDIGDRAAVEELTAEGLFADVTHIMHLAAQAGVRYSLTNPYAYIQTNVMGQVVLLEAARAMPKLVHFAYASSSSVYGGNTKIPFSIDDPVDKPVSLYAATKRMDELMAHTYAHLYGLRLTGFRFFTVYGPWGRPDMAAYIFARNIVAGKPIPLFNHGKMKRDFTFVDDIVAGVVAALDKPPAAGEGPHVYNLGNAHAEDLMDYVGAIEAALGRKAVYDFQPMQPGDVPETYADIEASAKAFGYCPRVAIAEGIPRFIAWFKEYHDV
jgi:UDP-glucuronate 4-epimerase